MAPAASSRTAPAEPAGASAQRCSEAAAPSGSESRGPSAPSPDRRPSARREPSAIEFDSLRRRLRSALRRGARTPTSRARSAPRAAASRSPARASVRAWAPARASRPRAQAFFSSVSTLGVTTDPSSARRDARSRANSRVDSRAAPGMLLSSAIRCCGTPPSSIDGAGAEGFGRLRCAKEWRRRDGPCSRIARRATRSDRRGP